MCSIPFFESEMGQQNPAIRQLLHCKFLQESWVSKSSFPTRFSLAPNCLAVYKNSSYNFLLGRIHFHTRWSSRTKRTPTHTHRPQEGGILSATLHKTKMPSVFYVRQKKRKTAAKPARNAVMVEKDYSNDERIVNLRKEGLVETWVRFEGKRGKWNQNSKILIFYALIFVDLHFLFCVPPGKWMFYPALFYICLKKNLHFHLFSGGTVTSSLPNLPISGLKHSFGGVSQSFLAQENFPPDKKLSNNKKTANRKPFPQKKTRKRCLFSQYVLWKSFSGCHERSFGTKERGFVWKGKKSMWPCTEAATNLHWEKCFSVRRYCSVVKGKELRGLGHLTLRREKLIGKKNIATASQRNKCLKLRWGEKWKYTWFLEHHKFGTQFFFNLEREKKNVNGMIFEVQGSSSCNCFLGGKCALWRVKIWTGTQAALALQREKGSARGEVSTGRDAM